MADFVSGWMAGAGISDGKWYTLDQIEDRIGMLGDSNIHVDPRNRMFMFNSAAQMMYIKVLSGSLVKYSAEDPRATASGYVVFTLSDGTKVIGRETDDGVYVSGLGKIHTFISYDNISGFFREGTTRESILELIKEVAY